MTEETHASAAELTATVIVPTTGDRGVLLPHSIGSILRQNDPSLEVFVLGDGVSDASRRLIGELCRRDGRIRFFDHPKHRRRGEEYRHAALAEARGRIVCYLCDRDFMLPHHVSTMSRLLEDADFGHSLRATFAESGIVFACTPDIESPEDLEAIRANRLAPAIPLSQAAHTLQMYRRLPEGWRTTPEYLYTDVYMWQQFLTQPGCRTAASPRLTVLHLKRGDYPGWPVERRLELLERWAERLADPGEVEAVELEAYRALARDHSALSRRLRPRSKQWMRRLVLEHPKLFAPLLLAGGPRAAIRRLTWRIYGRKT